MSKITGHLFLPVNYQLLKKYLHKRSELGISEIMGQKLVHNYNLRGKIYETLQLTKKKKVHYLEKKLRNICK